MTHRYEDILAFLEVVKTGSFTAAAERLKLSKSVVSDRVRGLEDALGVELLRRTTRSVRSTERGRDFFDSLQPLVAQFDEAVDAASAADGPLTGRLRITGPMSFGMLHLVPMITVFAKAHPELEIALDLDDRAVDIIGQGYDLAVRIGRLADSSLVVRRLCDSPRVLCCSPDYAKRHGLPREPADLAEHASIDYANIHSSRLWSFEPAARGEPPRVVATRSRIVVNNGEAMRDMAIAGMGMVLLPRFIVADALNGGSLIEVMPDAPPLCDTIYAVYAPTRHMPRKLRALVDHLIASFSGTPVWMKPASAKSVKKPRSKARA